MWNIVDVLGDWAPLWGPLWFKIEGEAVSGRGNPHEVDFIASSDQVELIKLDVNVVEDSWNNFALTWTETRTD